MAEAIVKWGNSHAVRIPLPHLRRAKLAENAPISITSEAGCITIRAARPKVLPADLLVSIPAGESFHLIDYGRAVGNEMAGMHPLLVLSTRQFNEKMSSVMGLAMTSKPHPHNPFQLKHPLSKLNPSFINTNHISTFDWRTSNAKPHPMGTLTANALKPVLEYLNAILQLT